MASLTEFKGRFDQIARPTLYKVSGMGPGESGQLEFFCKATSIPEATLGMIEVPYLGRKVKVPGDRTFVDWTITIIQDESFQLRRYFEDWMNAISDPNEIDAALESIDDMKEDVLVQQLAQNGEVISEWNLIGAFPISVSAIELAFDSNDTPMEFTVSMSFDYFTRNDVR